MERLNKVAEKQTVRLTHYGRKSGKPYEVTIWFVAKEGRIYLGDRKRESAVGAQCAEDAESPVVHRERKV